MTCKACSADLLLALGAKGAGVTVQEVWYVGGEDWPFVVKFTWNEKKAIVTDKGELHAE